MLRGRSVQCTCNFPGHEKSATLKRVMDFFLAYAIVFTPAH
jgi:hypothetical protein